MLVVSELVTNAVRHAPGPCRLRLHAVADAVELTVSDTSPEPPHPRRPDLTSDTGGFGWFLLHSLAASVRVTSHTGGKSIRALVLLPRP